MSKRYPAQPLVSQAALPAWHASHGYQWSKTCEYSGAKIPIVPRVDFVLPPPLPPLEAATTVDIGFDASTTVAGRLHSDLTPDQIRITPAVDAYAQVDVGLEALGGVIGQGLGVRPEVGVSMPVVYDLRPQPGQGTVCLDQPCVSIALKGNVYTKILFKKIYYGTVTIYSDAWPSGCQPTGAGIALDSAFEPPVDLFMRPSIAADGLGHAMAVWAADQDAATDIVDPEVQFSHWGSEGWSDPEHLTNNDRYETDPDVAPSSLMAARWQCGPRTRSRDLLAILWMT